MEVEGRAGDLVENADSPGRRKAANPISDCALYLRTRAGDAGVQVGPDIFLACDWMVFLQRR